VPWASVLLPDHLDRADADLDAQIGGEMGLRGFRSVARLKKGLRADRRGDERRWPSPTGCRTVPEPEWSRPASSPVRSFLVESQRDNLFQPEA
jgi:hypothetical protein